VASSHRWAAKPLTGPIWQIQWLEAVEVFDVAREDVAKSS
jgi:hypothetical protein